MVPGYSCIFLSCPYISVERHFISTGFQFDLLSHPPPWLYTCVKHVCIVKMLFSSLHKCSVLYGSNSICNLQKTSIQNFISHLCAFFLPHNSSLGELFMVVSPSAGYLSQLNRNSKSILEYKYPSLLTVCMRTGLME